MAGRSEFQWSGERVSRRIERNRRVALIKPVLRHYGLTLNDWGGSSYLLENRAGASEEVYQLNGIWSAAEALAGRPCDPLDPELIASIKEDDHYGEGKGQV